MPTRTSSPRHGSRTPTQNSSVRRGALVIAGLLLAGLVPLASTDPALTPTLVTASAQQPIKATPHSATPSSPPTPIRSAGLPDLLAPTLRQLGATVEADGQVRVGIAVVAVGPPGAPVVTAGSLVSAPAWSTIKVPLVLATQHQQSPGPETQALMAAAITRSDNAAADQLYARLGDAATASTLVQAQLASHGDPTTTVPSQARREGFSIIGQTDWPLSDAALFSASLPCSSDAALVWQLMGQITAEQRWGMGRVAGAHFKGGWGPQPDGGYLVRQLGVVPTAAGGMVAMAVVAQASDGNFGSATAALDRMIASVTPLLAGTTTPPCTSPSSGTPLSTAPSSSEHP